MNRSSPPLAAVLLAGAIVLAAGCTAVREPAIPAGGAVAPPLEVGFLLLDGAFATELTAPLDVFRCTASRVKGGLRVFTVGRTRRPVTTFEGLSIRPDHGLRGVPRIDVLVVPGGAHSRKDDLQDLDLVQWIAERGRNARHVMSLGGGAFLLAEAGLLRDRRFTTFPGDIPAFRKDYPHLAIVEDVDFVADHETVTGVGGARSFAPALYLVETLYGRKTAEAVARGLGLDWRLERTRHLIAPGTGSAVPPARRLPPG